MFVCVLLCGAHLHILKQQSMHWMIPHLWALILFFGYQLFLGEYRTMTSHIFVGTGAGFRVHIWMWRSLDILNSVTPGTVLELDGMPIHVITFFKSCSHSVWKDWDLM